MMDLRRTRRLKWTDMAPFLVPGLPVIQALSVVGFFLMIFQVCIYPILIKVIGITVSQRAASVVSTPLYAGVPLLALLAGNKDVLFAATIVVVFLIDSSSNLVSNHGHSQVEGSRKGTTAWISENTRPV